MPNEIRKIRIVQAPAGEAPLWVREAWVGIDLPVVRGRGLRNYPSVGVLSGPKTLWQHIWWSIRGRTTPARGYLVRTAIAIELLSASAPAAADWWRENTPHLLKGILIFEEKTCRLLFSDPEKSAALG
jgi:hypothetical protein